jgi:type IV pilus assembly protein PilM
MAGMFSKLIGSLGSGLFSSAGKSVLGVDIGNSSIKVVQLRKEKGVALLETYGEIALGPYASLETGRSTNLPADKLSEALKDLMQEANVTTMDCGVSVPFASSLITLIEMPALDQTQLAKMIPIEARKYIPVPITEVQLDWFVIPNDDARFFSKDSPEQKAEQISGPAAATPQQQAPKVPTSTTTVLLVAIHNEMLRKYAEVLTLSGLKPAFFEIEIFSSIRAVMDRGTAPFVVIDIGASSTKLYVVEYGIVRVSHIISKGSQDITLSLSRSLGIPIDKAEKMKRELGLLGAGTGADGKSVSQTAQLTMEFIFSEAKRSILSYQKRYNKNVNKIVFTGAGASIQGLKGFAAERFDMEVVLADPFQKVQSPAFLEEVLKGAGPDFAVAVGLALRKLQEEE